MQILEIIEGIDNTVRSSDEPFTTVLLRSIIPSFQSEKMDAVQRKLSAIIVALKTMIAKSDEPSSNLMDFSTAVSSVCEMLSRIAAHNIADPYAYLAGLLQARTLEDYAIESVALNKYLSEEYLTMWDELYSDRKMIQTPVTCVTFDGNKALLHPFVVGCGKPALAARGIAYVTDESVYKSILHTKPEENTFYPIVSYKDMGVTDISVIGGIHIPFVVVKPKKGDTVCQQ